MVLPASTLCPIAVLLEPPVFEANAATPTAMLLLPEMLFSKVPLPPMATLFEPTVLLRKATLPNPVLV